MILKKVENIRAIIEGFSALKIMVVGDIMLDRYWWGSVERISPEAPVPVVRLEKTSLVPGGAANVAANVAALGAKPILMGVIGQDEEGRILAELLRQSSISPNFLLRLKNHPTTVKTRIVAHNQHVVRVDNEKIDWLAEKQENQFWNSFEKELENADLLIISDYAKGLLSENLVKRLITTAKAKNRHVLIDPKGKDYTKYAGATLLTPNQREAKEASGIEDHQNDAEILAAGEQLIAKLNLAALLITRGENGMTLFESGKKTSHFKTRARTVYDVTGAGDTVIAVLGVALAAGADLPEAAELSNIAAGLVVEEVGTTTIDRKKLLKGLN